MSFHFVNIMSWYYPDLTIAASHPDEAVIKIYHTKCFVLCTWRNFFKRLPNFTSSYLSRNLAGKNTLLPPISAILARLHHLVVLSQPPKVEALKNATNTRRNKIAFQLTLYTWNIHTTIHKANLMPQICATFKRSRTLEKYFSLKPLNILAMT